MTSSVQTSAFSNEFCFKSSFRKVANIQNFYQVEVQDFDGCSFDFDVEARSYEEAAAKVEALAAESFIQVYNMNIYLVD